MSMKCLCPAPALLAAAGRLHSFLDDTTTTADLYRNVRIDASLVPPCGVALTGHAPRSGASLVLPVPGAVVERPGAALCPPAWLRDAARRAGKGAVGLESRLERSRAGPGEKPVVAMTLEGSDHTAPAAGGYEADVFPAAPEPLAVPGWSLRRGQLALAVDWCLMATDSAHRDGRYAFAGAVLAPGPAAGLLILVATNGHRLHTCELAGDPTGPGAWLPPGPVDCVVPSAAWKGAAALATGDDDPIEVRYDPGPGGRPAAVEFRAGPARLAARPLEGRFPRWPDMVPAGGPLATLAVPDARELARFLELGAACTCDEARAVELEVHPATRRFLAWSEASETGLATCGNGGEPPAGWTFAGDPATGALVGKAITATVRALGRDPAELIFWGYRLPIGLRSGPRRAVQMTIESPGHAPRLVGAEAAR